MEAVPELKPRGGVAFLGSWMVVAIAVVAALAYWDEQREASAAFDDFAREQASVAAGVSAALRAELTPRVLDRVRSLEQPERVRVLVRWPGAPGLVDVSGSPVDAAAIAGALDAGQSTVRLSREQAARLGLLERTAIAGLSTFDAGTGGR